MSTAGMSNRNQLTCQHIVILCSLFIVALSGQIDDYKWSENLKHASVEIS